MSIVTTIEEAWEAKQRWGIIDHHGYWGTELRLGRFSAFFRTKQDNGWKPHFWHWFGDPEIDYQNWLLLWRRCYVTHWGKKNYDN